MIHSEPPNKRQRLMTREETAPAKPDIPDILDGGFHEPHAVSMTNEEWHDADALMTQLSAGLKSEDLAPTKARPVNMLELRRDAGEFNLRNWFDDEGTAAFYPMMQHVDKDQLQRFALAALQRSGVLNFLQKNFSWLVLPTSRLKIAIDYAEKRDPYTQAFWHQDGNGRSLFSVIVYGNDTQRIRSPEWMVPDDLLERLDGLRGRQPDRLVDALVAAAKVLPRDAEIGGGYLPERATLCFMNPLFIHTTPYPRSRGVPPATLKASLGMYLQNHPDSPSGDILERLAAREDVLTLYKPDLVEAGLSDAEAVQLLTSLGAQPEHMVLKNEKLVPLRMKTPNGAMRPRKMSDIIRVDGPLPREKEDADRHSFQSARSLIGIFLVIEDRQI